VKLLNFLLHVAIFKLSLRKAKFSMNNLVFPNYENCSIIPHFCRLKIQTFARQRKNLDSDERENA
jgi:hypothetical protein